MISARSSRLLSWLVVLVAASASAEDVASRMAAMVAEFRPDRTLADWRVLHPGDRVETYRLDEKVKHVGVMDDWCARAVNTVTLPDGRLLRRYVYFFAPEPPADEPLPPLGSTASVESCRLGHLWVETAAPDPAAAMQTADQLQHLLATRFAAPEPRPTVSFFGSAFWEHQASWRQGPVQIVSAYDKSILGENPRLVAFATTPAAQSMPEQRATDDYDHLRQVLRAAAASAGIAPQAAEIEQFLDKVYAPGGLPDDQMAAAGAELASVLDRWMQQANAWTGERRSAALLIADLTLSLTSHLVQDKDSPARARLTRLGAVFEWSELGAGWVYVHNWLRQAAELPRGGGSRELAFTEWLDTGLQQHCCCADGSENFRRVISAGDDFLRAPHPPALAARVQFMVGDAYLDIVALAGGAGDVYADAKNFQAEAPRARSQALAHYHAGLELDRQSPQARAAWRAAWRLAAGLGTAQTRFFCVYD